MYCTPEDVRRLSEVLAGATDADIGPFIAKAAARIDAHLARRYVVPLAEPVPPVISSIAADMAAGFMLDQAASAQSKDQVNYGELLQKRAQADLERVVDEGLLDGWPGVALRDHVSPGNRPCLATTTPARSPLEEVLAQW